MIPRKCLFVSCLAVNSILFAASAFCATTTATVHINPDQVGPNDDATSRTFEDATAVNKRPERETRLLNAALDDDYRETKDDFIFYRGVVLGNETDDTSGRRFVPTNESHGANIGRQPVGPLTGRVIFASGGHGWTNDNTSTSLWYTQRPETNGMVEDLGNLDQMNFYADLCFRAGATVVPLRPVGFQHIERVIDNDSSHAEFHGQWADSQSTVSFGFDGARIPYRFARAAVEESAVARFRPVIPVEDEYPVYAWVRAGADRVIQTYRIVHAGAVTEVDVDHRRVGNGWVYLGSYIFTAGNDGYVEVTNKVRDARQAAAGGVVIADAIRFGNGMGDVNRGGGISGRPREEEASVYWVQRSLDPDVPPIYEGFLDLNDQSNNVGAAPRFAAYMNRETEGGFFDRLFLSFHSNASGGRGVVGLFDSHAVMRPDHQSDLAKLAAIEVNSEMTRPDIKLRRSWHVGKHLTDAHINFGEIRKDYLNNEMSATIVEVAYHDNADDAAILRQLSARRAVAEAAYRTTLRFFREIGGAEIDYYAPPDAPRLLSVGHGATSGTIRLQWTASTQDSLASPTKEIQYRIYRSTDGVAFDIGKDVGTNTHYTFKRVADNKPTYFKVTAVSLGGESRPSAVLGASLSNGPRLLIAQGVSLVTDDASLTETATANLGAPTRPGGGFTRLVPRIMNNGEQVRAIGSGVHWMKLGFDSADISQITSTTKLQPYGALCIMMGRNPVPEDFVTTSNLSSLHDYVTSGGRLMVSGANLAECDAATTAALNRWGQFTDAVFQTNFEPRTTVTSLIKSGDRELTTVTLRLGDRAARYFEPRPTEALKPLDKGRPVLAYKDSRGAAAVATLKDKEIRTAILGFPLEELDNREEQAVLAAQLLIAMGLEKPVEKPSVTTESKSKSTGKIVIEDSDKSSKKKKTKAKK